VRSINPVVIKAPLKKKMSKIQKKYLNQTVLVLKENTGIFKEVLRMGDKEFFDVIEESGLGEKWRLEGIEKGREEGIEKGKIQIAAKMIQDGISVDKVSKYSDIPVEKLGKLS
jgi:predicted transposase/invertase (TIGR01784 family)